VKISKPVGTASKRDFPRPRQPRVRYLPSVSRGGSTYTVELWDAPPDAAEIRAWLRRVLARPRQDLGDDLD
jgi:hypothetical protein